MRDVETKNIQPRVQDRGGIFQPTLRLVGNLRRLTILAVLCPRIESRLSVQLRVHVFVFLRCLRGAAGLWIQVRGRVRSVKRHVEEERPTVVLLQETGRLTLKQIRAVRPLVFGRNPATATRRVFHRANLRNIVDAPHSVGDVWLSLQFSV